MLFRILVVCLYAFAVLAASARTADQRVAGTWKAELPDQEIIFRSDHTFTFRNGSYRSSGTWRVAGDRLTTIATSFATGQERVHTCTYKLRGEKLLFKVCNAVTKSHGHEIGKPEMYMNSTSYERVR
jgi:hypothetical protein